MSKNTLPKAVRSAINAQAFHMAHELAYKALRDELEARAYEFWTQPKASVEEVIRLLAQVKIAYGPMISLQQV